MQVFVTGGTGLVGSRLVRRLMARGDRVEVLTRRYAHARQQFGTNFTPIEGDPTQPGEWTDHAAQADAVVNLAGENVFARRWHPAFKQLLSDSRVQSTENVVAAMNQAPRRADGQSKVLVNASAIGYYGPHGDEELTEDSPPGSDFLADVCVRWEKAALAAQTAGVRTTLVRVGVVLDTEGGALARLLTPFKLFAGGPVAGGRQWMSWIHHADLTDLLLFALDNPEASGPFNGTAPTPVTNRDFAKALGQALHRPAFVPTPALALRLAFGEVAEAIVSGQRVLPAKALQMGFAFKFPTVDAALADAVRQ
jgi:uncharacterized protein (TIGR01777 family)